MGGTGVNFGYNNNGIRSGDTGGACAHCGGMNGPGVLPNMGLGTGPCPGGANGKNPGFNSAF